MKNKLMRFFLCTLLFALSLGLFLLPSKVNAERELIRVGFFPFEGYHMEDGDGNKSGYGYEYLKYLQNYTNWDYEYVGYEENRSWNEMLTMLENGEIDLVTSASKTTEREEKFLFSDESIGTSSTILTVKAGNNTFLAGDYQNWTNIRVGLIYGSTRNDRFSEFANKNSIVYVPSYFNTTTELKEELEKGSIDAILTSDLRAVTNEWVIASFDKQPFYLITRKDRNDLMNEANRGISELYSIYPNIRETLFRKYYSPKNGSEIAYTTDELAFIQSSKENNVVFSVIINPDRKPYSYISQNENKGIMTDISSEILKRTGLSFSFVDVTNRSEYKEQIKEGSPNIVLDLSSDFNLDENIGYVIASPYYTAQIARLFLRSYRGEIKTVALIKDSLLERNVVANYPYVTVVEYDDVSSCVEAVRKKEVDATYLYNNMAQSVVYEDERNTFNCITVPSLSQEFAIGVSKDADYRLASILSKATNSLSEDDIQELSSPYAVNDAIDTTLLGLFFSHPFFFYITLFILFAVASLVIIVVILKREQSEAARANAAKSDFLSRMSHDIRTPLNGIIGMTYIASEESNPPKTTDALKKIDTSSKFLLGLINDVLDMTKAESNKIELHPEPYYIETLYQYLDSVIKPLVQSKNQLLIIDSAVDSSVVPLLDILRTNQIIFNLLSNAVKYTPEGGTITFEVQLKKAEEDKADVIFEVRDTGIGMSEEFQKHVFEPFTQENRSDTSDHRGTGLGLAIVKKLVDLMNGDITIKSAPQKGSVFKVTLKTATLKANNVISGSSISGVEIDKLSVFEGKHILLVEDHPLNQEIAKTILEEKKMIVTLAIDGKQAVDAFRGAVKNYYDLILMDIRMPIMDGYEATRTIRSLNRIDAKSVPIIAMTADAFEDDIAKAKTAGMNDHLSKPINPDRFYEMIALYLKR